jgi:translation initiation factor eIF-2B subunit gamma
MILAHGPAGPRIAHALKSAYNGAADVRVLTLEGPALGSADALAQVKDKIKHDIVVLGCDLITDVDPHTFLDYHRASTPSVTALLYEPKWEAGTPPKENPFSGLIGVDRKSRDLLLMTPLDEEEFRLRNSLLWKYPSIDLYTCLQDAHAYVMKRWVVDFLVGKPKLASIREDLLPLLAKAQYKRGMVGAQGLDAYTSPSGSALFQEALAISSTTSPVAKDPSLPSVKAYISRDVYTQRVNTLANYAEVNRYLIKDWAGDRVAKTAEIAARTQIGQDSLVGEGSRIDERSSVKRSVLGSGCRIGKGCKIVNSILMDNVAIDDKYGVLPFSPFVETILTPSLVSSWRDALLGREGGSGRGRPFGIVLSG